jgi:delta(3,5)-delta(2,4)-dienoyl-CoA isomerase
MFYDLGAIFNRLSHDPDVRAVILTANGDRAFSAGLDVQSASESGGITKSVEQDPGRRAVALRRHILEMQAPITSIEACEKPVIVVMHGISYGLAIDISTCCDVRICTKDTRFSVREVNIGLAADVGTLSRLPQTGISMSFIKDVALSARDFSAQEALQVGFVSGVHEDKRAAFEKALELAKLMASKSPVAVQGTKEVINFSRDHTVKDGELREDLT